MCPHCKAPITDDRGFNFCSKCGLPYFQGNRSSAFEILGAPRRYTLDERALETRYYELSKILHPDRHSTASVAAKINSQELSALLNQAYLALKNPDSRLEALLDEAQALEKSEKTENSTQIPTDLAEEYFEIQEAIMEDSPAAQERALNFYKRVSSKQDEMTKKISSLAETVDWENPKSEASATKVSTIAKMCKEQAYVRSLIQNLHRLLKE